MRYLIYFALLMLSMVGIGTARPIGKDDTDLKAQEEKRLQDCLTPDRPRPDVEGQIQRKPQLCGKAISLPKPAYPEEAKAQKITGKVSVEIVIDEKGNVEWAKAFEGHPLLRTAALKAACQARYSPSQVSGHPRKSQNVITYSFVK